MIHRADKLWGHEEWLVNTEKYCSKILYIKHGYLVSYHYHKIKDETFYILNGAVRMMIADRPDSEMRTIQLNEKDQIRIYPNMPHSFESLTDDSRILEVSTHHEEEDSYRLTPSRKL